jgi:hypothetical protein
MANLKKVDTVWAVIGVYDDGSEYIKYSSHSRAQARSVRSAETKYENSQPNPEIRFTVRKFIKE